MSHPWKVLHNQCEVMEESPSTYGSIPSNIDSTYRLVVPRRVLTRNIQGEYHERLKSNLTNVVKTTKYTIWNFLPKNLFEQFHRFANMYFLAIAILNWIPAIKAFAKEITMLPLVFVLSVTLVKDLYEDQRRRRSDFEVNHRQCLVYDSDTSQYVKSIWERIQTGDIVKLSNDEIIPADILLLHSSDPNDICHIETANLDGETNLKQREVVKNLSQDQEILLPVNFSCHIHCEEPNNKIYQFRGYIKNGTNTIPIGKNNLLLRGCVLRNTEYVEGIVIYAGHDTKAMRNNSGPRSKRSKLERDMNSDVIACVCILLLLCLFCAIGCGLWTKNKKVFDHLYSPELDLANEDVIQRSPNEEGFVRFWTFIIVFQVLIPISLYVSVEIVKLGQCFFIANDIEMYYVEKDQPALCRALNINEDLGQIKYVFSDKTGTLTENKMVFKRCSIAGKDFSHKETNSTDQKQSGSKQSPLNSAQNTSELDETDLIDGSWDSELADRINKESSDNEPSPIKEFFTLLAICNTVVVASPSSNPVISNGSLNDEQFLRNGQATVDGKTNNLYLNGRSSSTSPTDENLKQLTYEAESPDEAALVKSANMYGYKLVSRSPDSVTIEVPEEGLQKYHLLHVLTFDSERKRMSVIVRRAGSGQILMYCKGADTAILSQLSKDSKAQKCDSSFDTVDGKESEQEVSLMEKTETHLNVYAREGLRTLCMARRELSEEEYRQWLTDHEKAEISLHNRDELLQESYCKIERDLELLGATGIEDRLQEGVPEAIATLRQAGLKVWVLTGDKLETAVNIAHSCRLLDDDMDKITLNASSSGSCAEQIQAWLGKVNGSVSPYRTISERPSKTKYGLIIDGQTLQYALEKPLNMEFLELAKSCQVVVCCRAAPVQKASVVRLVREELAVMTLAIGDGANDVSMIQVADIGVGISGQEGMQAVQASDFAIGRFRFLVRLLLVHGHWCYDRISKLLLYFFYKNMMFVMVLFWFQLYNGFSGSNAINDLNLIFFNLIFTAVPPIVSGIWDQDVPCETLLKFPHLYKQGQESQLYSRKLFWITMFDGMFQSVVIFFSSFLVYSGTENGLFTVGITLHQCAVIVASLYIAIETSYWTIIHAVVLGLSVLLSFIWCIVYSVLTPALPDYYVAIVTMGTGDFWFLCILATTLSLLPRFLTRTIQQSLWPTDIQKAREGNTALVSLISYQNRAQASSQTDTCPGISGITT